jgi:hypothetical protein
VVGIVERFNSKGVSGERETFFSGIPNSKCEHAVEPREAVDSIFCPCLKKDLGIGLGSEDGPAGFEVATELNVVVDFAIKNEVPAIVGGGHRLGTTREVKDTEASMTQANCGVGVRTFRIRPAMGQGIGHFGKSGLRMFRGVTVGGESCDAAHKGIDSTEAGVDSRLELG